MYTDYDYEELYDDELPVQNKRSFSVNKNMMIIIIVFGVIAIALIGYSIYSSRMAYYDSYEYLEVQLVDAAKEYVRANNYSSTKEYFIKSSRLGVALKSDCKAISGVFVNGSEYKSYLVCDSYESDIITNGEEYVRLNGKNILFLAKGIDYVESSYLPLRDVKVNINGEVGTEEGVYDLSYVVIYNNMIADILKRKVVVIDDPEVESFYPTVNLRGNRIEYLTVGDVYVDQGVISIDTLDGVLENIQVESNVNTSIDGEYRVTYIATNSRGYANAASRKVIVANKTTNISLGSIKTPISLTNDKVTITVSVFGDNYAYTILPDMTTTTADTFSYTVTNNGIYNFAAYDKNGNNALHSVEVTNIYRVPPTGTCVAKVYPTYVDVTASATSEIGISGYQYSIDGKSSGNIVSTTYLLNTTSVNTVTVNVTDTIGNNTTINCTLQQMDPTIGNNNVTFLTKYSTEYVVVNTKNSVTAFERAIVGKITQKADTELYGDKCLGFAEYHTCKLVYGDLNNLSATEAAGYNIGCEQRDYKNTSKELLLQRIFNEIIEGYPVVLMVNGNPARTSRHFVTVIGYKRSVYRAEDLTEEDLLIIDSWDGKIESMDRNLEGETRRTMFKQDGEYRIRYIIR